MKRKGCKTGCNGTGDQIVELVSGQFDAKVYDYDEMGQELKQNLKNRTQERT